jgi:hypothetical protein
MIKPSEIQIAAMPVLWVFPGPGPDVQIGPVIPVNHRRYVYSIKAINQFAGVNRLTVGSRENGAAGTTVLWGMAGVLLGDIDVDPDGPLTEDSVPLFSVGGQGPLGPILGISTVRVLAEFGNWLVTMRYVDSITD